MVCACAVGLPPTTDPFQLLAAFVLPSLTELCAR